MFKGLPQLISPAGSNSQWLNGVPFLAEVFMAFEDDLEGYLAPVIEESLTFLNQELAASLARHPEWLPYTGKVGVEWTGQAFQMRFYGTPEEIAAMQNLEYGYEIDQSPLSVTRATILDSEAKLSANMTNALSEEVGLA